MDAPDPALWTTIGPFTGDGIATFLAAVVAAGIAVLTYRGQRRQARRDRQAEIYGEAIRAVEDYAEAPYRVRRRDGTPATHAALITHLHEVQSRLAYYTALLDLHAPRAVAYAYQNLVYVLKEQAGPQISDAWNVSPIRRARAVPLGAGGRYSRDRIDQASQIARDSMRHSLR